MWYVSIKYQVLAHSLISLYAKNRYINIYFFIKLFKIQLKQAEKNMSHFWLLHWFVLVLNHHLFSLHSLWKIKCSHTAHCILHRSTSNSCEKPLWANRAAILNILMVAHIYLNFIAIRFAM